MHLIAVALLVLSFLDVQWTPFVLFISFQKLDQLCNAFSVSGSNVRIGFVSLQLAPILAFAIILHRSLAGMSIFLFSYSKWYSIPSHLTLSAYISFRHFAPFFARRSALSFYLFSL
jgi:hypothetical protein